jgi:RNA polymerase sigma-70 factor (ECF subfamily)
MAINSDSSFQGGRFPTTKWELLSDIDTEDTEKKINTVNFLMKRYWKPVYCFVRRHGYNREKSQDVVQEFFLSCFEKDTFIQADQDRGRFRTFLCKCVENFMRNYERKGRAKKRRPSKGFISIDELMEQDKMYIEPSEHETPEDIFNRAWAIQLIYKVIDRLKQVCERDNQSVHYDIFYQRVLGPLCESTKAPSFQKLGDKHLITAKEASNRVISIQRKFKRLLVEEVKQYTLSEKETLEEIRDIFRFVAS